MTRRIITVPIHPKRNPLLCLLCLRRYRLHELRSFIIEGFGHHAPTPIRLRKLGPAICEDCAYAWDYYDRPNQWKIYGPRLQEAEEYDGLWPAPRTQRNFSRW